MHLCTTTVSPTLTKAKCVLIVYPLLTSRRPSPSVTVRYTVYATEGRSHPTYKQNNRYFVGGYRWELGVLSPPPPNLGNVFEMLL